MRIIKAHIRQSDGRALFVKYDEECKGPALFVGYDDNLAEITRVCLKNSFFLVGYDEKLAEIKRVRLKNPALFVGYDENLAEPALFVGYDDNLAEIKRVCLKNPVLFVGYDENLAEIIHDVKCSNADTNEWRMAAEIQEIPRNNIWRNPVTQHMKTVSSSLYICLPCAGGSGPGNSQQDHSQIYQESLNFVSKCPNKNEYMNKTLEKCVNVCGNYILDGNCAYHCMRDSSKTKLVECCAKPKILFDYCPEYDPVDQTIQKDLTTLCNSTFPMSYYNSSDIYFCDPNNCLKLYKTSSGAIWPTTSMNGTTEMNDGDFQQAWSFQYWLLILLLVGVAIVVTIVILRKRGARHQKGKRPKTEENRLTQVLVN